MITINGPAQRFILEMARPSILDHYLRLSPEDRYARFGYNASDTAIEDLVNSLNAGDVVTLRFDFATGRCIGVAMARPVNHSVNEYEIAVSVDAEHRNSKVATMMLSLTVWYVEVLYPENLTFAAYMLSDNGSMYKVLKELGFDAKMHPVQLQFTREGKPMPYYLRFPFTALGALNKWKQ